LTDREFTRILDWPGYRVYRHEIDEQTRTLKLFVRRKGGNQVLVCSGCGGRARKIEEVRERMVRDLPWRKYQAIVVVEFYRVRCPQCGLKVEQVPQLPGKAPFSKDFEDEVGLACESATNMLERIMEEIKRRTLVVRIFPNAAGCSRLVRDSVATTSSAMRLSPCALLPHCADHRASGVPSGTQTA
jgi:transposase